MFQYLPHRRRLCDEPNHAHPPAVPAALERKHPVDARQQLRPQISRRVSCPRCAKICAHCLWPGCLTPRPRLPASLRPTKRQPMPPRHHHPTQHVQMQMRVCVHLRGWLFSWKVRIRSLAHSVPKTCPPSYAATPPDMPRSSDPLARPGRCLRPGGRGRRRTRPAPLAPRARKEWYRQNPAPAA